MFYGSCSNSEEHDPCDRFFDGIETLEQDFRIFIADLKDDGVKITNSLRSFSKIFSDFCREHSDVGTVIDINRNAFQTIFFDEVN